ncbi:RHS repeat-associated core domain-containing protein [Actinomadura spongiicola]|uniref:RHS repeat-associated core domain-containing protein n=1 Tax=Actinomadura spongiicola TaxID=2303421 RepID=UPI003898FF30
MTDTATTVDDALTLTGSAQLDPFGAPISTSGTYTSNPLQFHGQYLDNVTGLHDIRARDYNATTGTFTATDPVKPEPGTPFTPPTTTATTTRPPTQEKGTRDCGSAR